MFQATQVDWTQWITYFEHNALNLMPIDWDGPYMLTAEEMLRVKRSIQEFQLGESSEGNHVIAQARRYVESSGDQDYLPALQRFIKEEQRHSRYLAQFLAKCDSPLLHKNTVDSVFRLLRHTFNLEFAVMAMLTAEIIAVPYYKALHDATGSPLLRQICRQVLRDEIQHLRFQTDTLKALRQKQLAFHNAFMGIVQRLLLTGTVCLVWQLHYPVLHGGGFTFAKFWRTNWRHFNRLFPKQSTQYATIIR